MVDRFRDYQHVNPGSDDPVKLEAKIAQVEMGRWIVSFEANTPEDNEGLKVFMEDLGSNRGHPPILIFTQRSANLFDGKIDFGVTEGPDVTANRENLSKMKFWEPK